MLIVNIAMISFTYCSYEVLETMVLNKELNDLASHPQDIKVMLELSLPLKYG
jgi:hypothetical protein